MNLKINSKSGLRALLRRVWLRAMRNLAEAGYYMRHIDPSGMSVNPALLQLPPDNAPTQ